MDQLILVSSDGHISMPVDFLPQYLEREFYEYLVPLNRDNLLFRRFGASFSDFSPAALEIIDKDRAIRSGGTFGVLDVQRRLEEMDREGVAVELLFQGSQLGTAPFFAPSNEPYPPEVRAAGRRAWHRYLSDYIAKADGRLLPVADPGPCLDMDEAIRELRWVVDHGFRTISVPGVVVDPALPPLWDKYYEPFWKTCADLNVVLSVHAGHG